MRPPYCRTSAHLRACAVAASALAVLGLAGCRRGAKPRPPAAEEGQARSAEASGPPLARVRCQPDPAFRSSWPIPEASAATEVELVPGRRELLVVSDSGNKGLVLAIPLGEAGPREPRRLTLPLDSAVGDDVEGAAWREHALYTLTSAGAVMRFVPDGHGAFVRERPAARIGPPPFSCAKLDGVNCGKNYEGLCLRATADGARCAGYAASKEEDALHCIVARGDELAIDAAKPPLKLALPPRALSDCAFGAAGGPAANVLVVTTNVHGGSASYVVDEASGAIARLDVSGHVSNEAIAVDRDGALYQLMDDNHEPSAGSRMNCVGW